MELKNKVAIVTGGSDGIGRAIAVKFAQEGAKVAIVSRTEEKLRRALDGIVKYSPDSMYVPANVGNPNDVRRVIQTVTKKYGNVDILVNNAGRADLDYIDNVPLETLSDTIDTNLKGPAFFTASVVPLFKKQKSGVIVDIISTAGIRIYGMNDVYGATKWGHRALSLGQELDLAEYGIKFYRVYPSNTKTSIFSYGESQVKRSIKEEGVVLNPEDIADLVLDMLKEKHRSNDLLIYLDAKKGKTIVPVIPRDPSFR